MLNVRGLIHIVLGLTLGVTGCSLKAVNPPDKPGAPLISGTTPVTADGATKSIITVTLKDTAGVPFVGVIPKFTATNSESKNSYGECTVSDSNGKANCSLSSTKAEVKQLTLTYPDVRDGGTIEFIPGPEDHLKFTLIPSNTGIAGTPLSVQPQITLYDYYDNILNNNTTPITLTPYSDPNCSVTGTGTLFSATNPTTPIQGVTPFSGISYTKAGNVYLGASGAKIKSDCSPMITISPAAPYKIVFTVQPPSIATAGTTLGIDPSIEIQDQYSNTITASSAAITIAAYTDSICSVKATGTFAVNSATVNTNVGAATFSGVSYIKAQTIYLKASSIGLNSACSSPITVSPGPPSVLTSTIIGTQPTAANAIHTSTVTITIKDDYGNARSGDKPTFTATNTDGSNIYGACSTTNSSGASSCSLRSSLAETKTLFISTPISLMGGTVLFIPPPVTANSSITGTGPLIADGISSSAITIVMKDASNAGVVGIRPTFSATNTASKNNYGVCSISDASGISTCTLKSTKAEAKTLSITLPLLMTGGTVVFNPGPPAAAGSTIIGSGPITANGTSTSNITLTIGDANSNAISGITPSFSATDTNSKNTYGACSVTSASGVSICTLSSTRAETKTLSITSPVSKSGGTVQFNAGAANKVIFSVQPSAVGYTCTPLSQQPSTQIQDVYDNPVKTSTLSITLGAYLDSGCTASVTGTFNTNINPLNADGITGTASYSLVRYSNPEGIYLKASASGMIASCSNLVSITESGPSRLTFTTQPSTESLIGDPFNTQPVVQVQNACGKPMTSASNAITLAGFKDSSCNTTASGTLSASNNPISASGGLASFSGVNSSLEEDLYLKATATGLTSTCSSKTTLIRWKAISSTSAPSTRSDHTAVWTGAKMLVWGGHSSSTPLNNGGAYDSTNDTWTTISTSLNNPAARWNHTAIWTGTEMIIWGGFDGANYLNSGAKYSPATNSWESTSITPNTPSGRTGHTMIWTGSQIIIWGGYDGSNPLNDGAAYDPITDTWTPLGAGSEVPAPRFGHTTTWTGSQMILWGGQNGLIYFNDGAAYDPATDAWASLPSQNAPSLRTQSSSVWSGTALLLWGGFDGMTPLDTGSIFNPNSGGSWMSTVTSGAPSARYQHSATWTGTDLVIWGGTNGSSYLDTGANFNPTSANWTTTSIGVHLPIARGNHTSVWANTRMIIWGGCTSGIPCSTTTATGAVYKP